MKIDSFNIISEHINQHIEVVKSITIEQQKELGLISNKISKVISANGTVLFCGNGGSAADSQHLAAEFVGRFINNRKPLSALALTTDTSVITCIANDFGYDEIFARQIESIGKKKDILIVISTSGNSKNILKAIEAAVKKGMVVVGLLGKNGGSAAKIIENKIIVESKYTARVQETHILLGHIICDLVEKELGVD